ncbi:hypothetical protein EY04_21785 [Pseudomonas chlororaphis]|nr:hypothetical protein EY04_21785 [Pseudomonas chlororaphis]
MVETGKSNGHYSRCITLNQNDLWFLSVQHIVHFQQQASSQRGQGLVWTHDVQIDILFNTEKAHDLVKHMAMLGCC